jgi:long-chain acyl-CoA synthetase
MNASIYLGLTFHVFRAFEPRAVLDLIASEQSTILFAVPTIFNRLLAEVEQARLGRSSLRYCVSGGASLPVEILRKFEERFQTKIYEGYGLTECSPVCVENPFERKTKPGSIGLPIPGFQARIVSPSRGEVPAGEVGELIVKGPGVMKGYLNRPDATAEAVVDGWLHTGDMARMDEEGYITIVDRKKDMIIRGGYNVYPREVEEVLFQHPAVFEAGVYGVPHADLGEEVAANVVLQPGLYITADELRDFVRARLAPYKYPRIIHLVDELPKSHTGKVLKRELRRQWSESRNHQTEEGSS